MRDMAQELLKLYAARRASPGHGFSPDSAWMSEFEALFEFEATPDQSQAIDDVKRDMERPSPMDRLLCGDVGYGKTEVAMRAAFKAITDGKQVAVLVPTTVLAFPTGDLGLAGKRPAHEYNPIPVQGNSGKLSWIRILDLSGCVWVAEQTT